MAIVNKVSSEKVGENSYVIPGLQHEVIWEGCVASSNPRIRVYESMFHSQHMMCLQ